MCAAFLEASSDSEGELRGADGGATGWDDAQAPSRGAGADAMLRHHSAAVVEQFRTMGYREAKVDDVDALAQRSFATAFSPAALSSADVGRLHGILKTLVHVEERKSREESGEGAAKQNIEVLLSRLETRLRELHEIGSPAVLQTDDDIVVQTRRILVDRGIEPTILKSACLQQPSAVQSASQGLGKLAGAAPEDS